jgi:hypothetical protein
VRNPSRRLRPVAVRVNLSCWVIREGDVPYALLNEMARGRGHLARRPVRRGRGREARRMARGRAQARRPRRAAARRPARPTPRAGGSRLGEHADARAPPVRRAGAAPGPADEPAPGRHPEGRRAVRDRPAALSLTDSMDRGERAPGRDVRPGRGLRRGGRAGPAARRRGNGERGAGPTRCPPASSPTTSRSGAATRRRSARRSRSERRPRGRDHPGPASQSTCLPGRKIIFGFRETITVPERILSVGRVTR